MANQSVVIGQTFYAIICFSVLVTLPVQCIVTPNNNNANNNNTLPSSSSTLSSSTTTTTTTPSPSVDTSASGGYAAPVYSDSLGRMMAASAIIQNLQNLTMDTSSSNLTYSPVATSLGTSSSSQAASPVILNPLTAEGGFKPSTLNEHGKSFIDIVRDYEKYKLIKSTDPTNNGPTLVYQGDSRLVKEREPVLTPSTLQGYNSNANYLGSDAYGVQYVNGQPGSSQVNGPSGPEDYVTWSEDGTAFGLPDIKTFSDGSTNGAYFSSSPLDLSTNYEFELLPQGTKTHNHEPPPSHVTYDDSKFRDTLSPLESAGFLNFHSLVGNMETSDDLPIVVESYVVNYPPLSQKPVAHSLSAFTFGQHPGQVQAQYPHQHHHQHHQHQHQHQQQQRHHQRPTSHAPSSVMGSHSHHNSYHFRPQSHHGEGGRQVPMIPSPSMAYPMVGPRPTSERVFISPYLYSRPCKYDCFASPLQDIKYGIMNFLEGAHNHGRRK